MRLWASKIERLQSSDRSPFENGNQKKQVRYKYCLLQLQEQLPKQVSTENIFEML